MSSGLTLARAAKSVGTELGHVAVGSVSEIVGGGGLGFVHARYKDKWYGEYAPEMAAGAGKIALALIRGFVGDGWAADVIGGVIASPGTVLTSAKYGIKLSEYLDEKKAKGGGQKQLPASPGPHGVFGYVPPAGASAMTISEAERRRFAAGR
jgi:hypothetical protein